MKVLEKSVPAFGWLRNYRRADLASDLSAALIVTAMLVPQGMAYALLAGLPPRYGLYASTVPTIVYALLGTSRHLPVGPFAITSLLIFTSVSAIAQPGSGRYVSLVLLLALMAGVLQFAMGLLRLGFVTNFISHPVLSGFIYASAIVIALSQVGNLLGIALSTHGSVVDTVLEIARKIDTASPITLAVSAGSIAALVILAKTLPRVPGPLVVVAGSTLVVYLFGLDRRGVAVVGEVPGGLPDLSLPSFDTSSLHALLPAALILAFVGFVASISAAKEIAAKEKYKVESNQELRALGLANISAAFFSGVPVAGSLSRAAVQYQSGGRTQLASIATAALIVVALLFLTPFFYYLPNAALAAIILVAVYKLIDLEGARRVFKVRRIDGCALLITFALTLLVGVEQGIILGAAFSLLAFIRRTAYPHIAELGYVEEKDAFLGLESFPEAKTYPEALIVRFDARLYFANVPYLEEWLMQEVTDRPDVRWVLIDCRGVNSIDVTAIEGLEGLISGYKSRGIEFVFTHMKLPIRERLHKAGWNDKFGHAGHRYHYQTTREALQAIGLPMSCGTRDLEQQSCDRHSPKSTD